MEYETKMDAIELVRGYLGVLLMVILFATGTVSAMFAGDTQTFKTNLTNPYYTVVGNNSDLIGMNITFKNGNITISTHPLMKPDNFILIFYDEITHETERIVYRGGGGGSSRTIIKNVENKTLYPVYLDQEVVRIKEVPFETIVEVETGFEWWHVLLAFVLAVIISAIIIKYYWKEDELT